MKVRTRSAGIVVVNRKDGEWRFLILRLYRNWEFPKGQIESGELPLEAALRETKEETEIEQLEFSWGQDTLDTPPYGAGKVATYFVARTAQRGVRLPINPELGRAEHHDYRWASYSEARALLPPRLLPVLDWAHDKIDRAPVSL